MAERLDYDVNLNLSTVSAQMGGLNAQMAGQFGQMMQPVSQAINFTYASGMQSLQMAQDMAWRAQGQVGPGAQPFGMALPQAGWGMPIAGAMMGMGAGAFFGPGAAMAGAAFGGMGGSAFAGAVGAMGLHPTASWAMSPLQIQTAYAQQLGERMHEGMITAGRGTLETVGEFAGATLGYVGGTMAGTGITRALGLGVGAGRLTGAAVGYATGGLIGGAFGLAGLPTALGFAALGYGMEGGAALYGPTGMGALGSLGGAAAGRGLAGLLGTGGAFLGPGGAVAGAAIGTAAGMATQGGIESILQGRDLREFAARVGMASVPAGATQSPFGVGFLPTQTQAFAGGMQRMMARDIRFGPQEYMDILEGGRQAGLFDTASTVTRFTERSRDLVESVRTIQSALHKTVGESVQVMQQFAGMGVTERGQVQQMALQMRTGMYQAGLPADVLAGRMAAGAQMAVGTYLAPTTGAQIGMDAAVQLRRMRQLQGIRDPTTGRDMTQLTIAGAGGEEVAGQVLAQSETQYAISTNMQQLMLAAYDPQTRRFDPGVVRRRIAGDLSREDIIRMASGRLAQGDFRQTAATFQADITRGVEEVGGAPAGRAARLVDLSEQLRIQGMDVNRESLALLLHRQTGMAQPQSLIEAQTLMDAPRMLREQADVMRGQAGQMSAEDMMRLRGPQALVTEALRGIRESIVGVSTGVSEAWKENVSEPMRRGYLRAIGAPESFVQPAELRPMGAAERREFAMTAGRVSQRMQEAASLEAMEIGFTDPGRAGPLLEAFDVFGATGKQQMRATAREAYGRGRPSPFGEVRDIAPSMQQAERVRAEQAGRRLTRVDANLFLDSSEATINSTLQREQRLEQASRQEVRGIPIGLTVEDKETERYKQLVTNAISRDASAASQASQLLLTGRHGTMTGPEVGAKGTAVPMLERVEAAIAQFPSLARFAKDEKLQEAFIKVHTGRMTPEQRQQLLDITGAGPGVTMVTQQAAEVIREGKEKLVGFMTSTGFSKAQAKEMLDAHTGTANRIVMAIQDMTAADLAVALPVDILVKAGIKPPAPGEPGEEEYKAAKTLAEKMHGKRDEIAVDAKLSSFDEAYRTQRAQESEVSLAKVFSEAAPTDADGTKGKLQKLLGQAEGEKIPENVTSLMAALLLGKGDSAIKSDAIKSALRGLSTEERAKLGEQAREALPVNFQRVLGISDVPSWDVGAAAGEGIADILLTAPFGKRGSEVRALLEKGGIAKEPAEAMTVGLLQIPTIGVSTDEFRQEVVRRVTGAAGAEMERGAGGVETPATQSQAFTQAVNQLPAAMQEAMKNIKDLSANVHKLEARLSRSFLFG